MSVADYTRNPCVDMLPEPCGDLPSERETRSGNDAAGHRPGSVVGNRKAGYQATIEEPPRKPSAKPRAP